MGRTFRSTQSLHFPGTCPQDCRQDRPSMRVESTRCRISWGRVKYVRFVLGVAYHLMWPQLPSHAIPLPSRETKLTSARGGPRSMNRRHQALPAACRWDQRGALSGGSRRLAASAGVFGARKRSMAIWSVRPRHTLSQRPLADVFAQPGFWEAITSVHL